MIAAGTVEVLLVEDNPHDAELTLRALKRHRPDRTVFVAKDGAEALEFLFSSPNSQAGYRPKVILLDLKLPKVDGLEVLRKIKSDERTRTIPVVVLTSSREDQDILESYALGVNSYVVKPVDFDQFLQSVSELGLYWLLLNELPC